jgi:hypothetical protein
VLLERFTTEMFEFLDETFEQHHGIYLDKGTSLFETLEGISAQETSRPVSGRCASIAAQVEHVSFYLDVLEGAILNEEGGKVDWGEIWRNARPVTAEEWAALKQRLKDTYQRILTTLKSLDTWQGEDDIGAAMAMFVHTAYHLGEIRQALCVVKETPSDA